MRSSETSEDFIDLNGVTTQTTVLFLTNRLLANNIAYQVENFVFMPMFLTHLT
jgi:hypothetical protein